MADDSTRLERIVCSIVCGIVPPDAFDETGAETGKYAQDVIHLAIALEKLLAETERQQWTAPPGFKEEPTQRGTSVITPPPENI